MPKNEKVHEALDTLKIVLGKYKAGEFDPAFEAAKKVIDAAGDLAEAQGIDVSKVLTGDLVHDRAVIEAAGVEAEIKATGISLDGAVELAGALLKFGTIIVAMV
ncbi:MAG: hypothetical protein PHC52_00490 [Syntrophales bacterium]|nr:hypothetical protein [Syntrophales bacterium]